MALYDYIQPAPPVPAKPPDLFASMGYVYEDLYVCHSPNDSRLWIELFVIASNINHDMAVRLEYVRGVGAWLLLDSAYGLRIQPVIDPAGVYGWSSHNQYETQGRYQLSVYGQEVVNCLGELRRRFDQGRIR